MTEITLPQRYSITTDISHSEALNGDGYINSVFLAAHWLPRFRPFLNLVTDTKNSANDLPATFLCNYAPYAIHGSSTAESPVYVQINFRGERTRRGNGNP